MTVGAVRVEVQHVCADFDNGSAVGGQLSRRPWDCGMLDVGAVAVEAGLEQIHTSTLAGASKRTRGRVGGWRRATS